jgi:hypothetical protein
MTPERMTQPIALRERHVEEWTDERKLGHGWFCLLREGWSYCLFDPEAREQSYETKADAFRAHIYPHKPEGIR